MTTPNSPIKVSIIIKTLNEEEKIARCIESALKAVETYNGEVILADSLSTDKTIEIAQQYPIKITQLTNPKERCCGIGPQLGYQIAQGEYVYILDGDMQMLDSFLPQAIEFLDQNPDFAGVGGKVIEMNKDSLEFQARVERGAAHMQTGEVDRLDMGGLYRKTAIEQVGYFSNRNLHSYEELDLAVRLRAKRWKLQRIDVNAVKHWGHDVDPYTLLIKRWKSGYINGIGEILRAAIGKPHFKLLIADVKELRVYFITFLWWLTLIGILISGMTTKSIIILFGFIFALPFILMVLKKQSIKKAIFSIISWNFNLAGLIRGFIQNPTISDKINAHIISNKKAAK